MAEDDVSVEYVHALMAIPEPRRSEWCKEVVIAIANGAEKIAKIQGKIPQAKAAKEFLNELVRKKEELLPVFYYMVKPEFRDTIQELLERFSGYVEG